MARLEISKLNDFLRRPQYPSCFSFLLSGFLSLNEIVESHHSISNCLLRGGRRLSFFLHFYCTLLEMKFTFRQRKTSFHPMRQPNEIVLQGESVKKKTQFL